MRLLTSRGRARDSTPVYLLRGGKLLLQIMSSWTFSSFFRELNQTQSTSTFFSLKDFIMYAKLLLQRNNMTRPREMKRSFVLKPTLSPFGERQHSYRTRYFPQLYLQARIPTGTLKNVLGDFLSLSFY